MPAVPHLAARLVAWGNAVIGGAASPDEAAERVTGRKGLVHRVLGLDRALALDAVPGSSGALDGRTADPGRRGDCARDSAVDVATLPVTLARLAGLGVSGLRLVLPVPGDAYGLPGPGTFNTEAVDAGEAVVAVGAPFGVVPRMVGGAVEWRVFTVERDGAALPWPSLGEADRSLREELLRVTEVLTDLDVARCGPAALEALERLRRPSGRDLLAPGYPARAVEVAVRAERLAAIVALASTDDGAAVSSTEAARRARALRDLGSVCRTAVVAAHDAVVAPGGRP